MRKLKIGYWPISNSLDAPGDRRRFIFWANSRENNFSTNLTDDLDVIIATVNSDFNSKIFKKGTPIIFDLVDAYLSPSSFYKDLGRGISKAISRQVSGIPKPFSQNVADFCRRVDAVICSCEEQATILRELNPNIHVILDSHEELPWINPLKRDILKSKPTEIVWEGQVATLASISLVTEALDILSITHDFNLNFITDLNYFKYSNKFFRRETKNLLRESLGHLFDKSFIFEWSIAKLQQIARESRFGIIPLNIRDSMIKLKPENRMLIMWRLGLPCLTSPLESYKRVASKAHVNAVCTTVQEWASNLILLIEDDKYLMDEILKGQNYLEENHNKSILLNKWDTVIESTIQTFDSSRR